MHGQSSGDIHLSYCVASSTAIAGEYTVQTIAEAATGHCEDGNDLVGLNRGRYRRGIPERIVCKVLLQGLPVACPCM